MKDFIPLVARVLLSAIFLNSGWGKIMNFTGTQEFMAAHGMPLTGLFLIGAIVVELAGGLSLLLGYKARWGSTALVVFLIPTTLIFHTEFSERIQMIMFMKNLAILGGLLMVTYFGPGPISFDERTPSPDDQ